ncbi:hypothetical protein BaRGS_00023846 [Batillaria attramentaria]|uniref:Uncharacterized protein n=1 Tax=Batillaria attramentaria TaxID=370345 RepID=A0ABD0KD59_9CAEN
MYLWQFVCVSSILLCLLHPGRAQTTTVCRFYESVTVPSSNPSDLRVEVLANSAAVSGTGLSTTLTSGLLTLVELQASLISTTTPDILLKRSVEVVDASADPPLLKLSTSLEHVNGSSASPLDGVTLSEDFGGRLQAYWGSAFSPGVSSGVAGLTITGRTYVSWSLNYTLAQGDPPALLEYQVEPSGDQGTNLQEGNNFFSSEVTFNDTTNVFGPYDLMICIKRNTETTTSILYEHGFTALTFFFALLLGFLLVVLGVFLFLFIRRRRKGASVSPTKLDERRMREKGKKIVMDPKAALKKGLNAIKDYSIIKWNESMVLLLSLKDKLHMFREIDNLDVLATIHVDTDLENEQNDAAIQTSFLLLQGLRHNGDITRQTEDRAIGNFNSALRDMDKKLQEEYKKELEVVYTDLSAKNKEKLAELLQKHRQQKQQAIAMTKELPEKERQSLLELIAKQQEMEENELTFNLALEQNEGAEKLRKRMGIKELQQGLMTEVITQGKLNVEQADWLIKEHKKQQEAVHRMYDDEISRQRMVLEEKLARRRALAQASETQEDDSTERLNLEASHIVGYLEKARKQSMFSALQAEEWIEDLQKNVLHIKTEFETAKEAQEADLHKRLSGNKIQQLSDLMKKQKAEVQDYMNKNKAQQTDGPVDPLAFADGLLRLKSQHRVELANLENKLDEEHAAELKTMRDQAAQAALDKLKEKERDLVQKLQDEGMTKKTVETLIQKYEAETKELEMRQAKNRRNQEDKLREELARRKREWAARREKEQQEQEDLREHEAEVVDKLVCSQTSMSEAERDRILKEHEKQMVMLENSLTLNKLRQQRALEERLAQKRAEQLSKLETDQKLEIARQRKIAENNGEEDDEDTQRAALDLMRQHARQRIAVMQGQQLNIDDELAEIRVEMTKERALALKGQEERLGAMITTLQMEKAREMTKIEEQQKAINSLKANLMDDLNERGILSTPECERILQVHKEESEQLHQRLEKQRSKQEKMLRSKLQERMQQRERLILARQESEMRALMEGSGNKMASKVRRVMLVHKHMVEMEKFRNRMDREINQSMADTRRQFEILKLQKLQEQELAFVAGLVRVGDFQQNELLDVLHMLFPGKTEEEINQVLQNIQDGTKKPANQDMDRRNSTLVERVYLAQYSDASMLNRSGSVKASQGSRKKKKLGKKGSRLSMTSQQQPIPEQYNEGQYYDYTSMNNTHNDYTPNYDDGMDFVAIGAGLTRDTPSAPVGRLPPLMDSDQPTKTKKKKKFLKRHAKKQDPDELY